MRFTILEKLTADTPLAQLFNAYLSGLSTIELFTTPRESMRLCRAAFDAEVRGEKPFISIVGQARRYYELTVLSNALGSLHRCVEDALAVLHTFFDEYDGDLHAYAVANRLRLIAEYGSDNETDWEPGTGAEEWLITHKADAASLSNYSLRSELGRFFPDEENHGDYIGTSGPEDFAHFTATVTHQTDFSLRKMFAAVAGKEITLSRQDENGEFVAIPVIDQIEEELNEDIANATLAGRFNAVLNACGAVATLYATMPADYLAGYRVLYECLRNVLAADVGEYAPF